MTQEQEKAGGNPWSEDEFTTEDFTDPLADLVERTREHSTAPFDPVILKAAAYLQRTNRQAFEDLRLALQNVGFKRLGAWDDEIDKIQRADGLNGTGDELDPNQVDIIISLVKDANLFHTQENIAFADVQRDGHRETWMIRSQSFKHLLIARYVKAEDRAPSTEAIATAVNTLEALACHDNPEHEVFIRVGGVEGECYLDLCNDDWEVVRITKDGRDIIQDPPIRFTRNMGMRALPTPVHGGDINELKQFLAVRTDADFVLTIAWLLAALNHYGPYPLAVILGAHGATKTAFSEILHKLIDPHKMLTRGQPKNEDDLFISAVRSRVLAYDNISEMPTWLSNALCRLSTGGGLSKRTLYTDAEETHLMAERPVIVNGITAVVTRPDLADRSACIHLERIPDCKRKPRSRLMPEFDKKHARILGALLDGVAEGLSRLPTITFEVLPRMADFALWATACETAYWEPGTFMVAYKDNIEAAVRDVLDEDVVATAIVLFMLKRVEWKGTATELLKELEKSILERTARSKEWPKAPHALTRALRKLATPLLGIGITVVLGERDPNPRRERIITLKRPHGFDDDPSERAGRHSDGKNSESDAFEENPSGAKSKKNKGKSDSDNGLNALDAIPETILGRQGSSKNRSEKSARPRGSRRRSSGVKGQTS